MNAVDRFSGIPIVVGEWVTTTRWQYDDWGRFWEWGDTPPSWAVYFGYARQVTEPAAVMVNGTLHVHPAVLKKLKAEFEARDRARERVYGGLPEARPGGFLHKGFS